MLSLAGTNTVLVSDRKAILYRWKKYTEELHETSQGPHVLDTEEEQEISDGDKKFKIPREQLEKAANEVKQGRAMNVDAIAIELIKKMCQRKGKNKCYDSATKFMTHKDDQETF